MGFLRYGIAKKDNRYPDKTKQASKTKPFKCNCFEKLQQGSGGFKVHFTKKQNQRRSVFFLNHIKCIMLTVLIPQVTEQREEMRNIPKACLYNCQLN